jgi:NCS1 family nucleobase:cation symporter-1
VVATAVGAVLAVGGAYSNPGAGPFPEHGLIPVLKPLYDYSWAVGLAAGLLVFWVLSALVPERGPVPQPQIAYKEA